MLNYNPEAYLPGAHGLESFPYQRPLLEALGEHYVNVFL